MGSLPPVLDPFNNYGDVSVCMRSIYFIKRSFDIFIGIRFLGSFIFVFVIGSHHWIVEQLKKSFFKGSKLQRPSMVFAGIAFLSFSILGVAFFSLTGLAVEPSASVYSASGISVGDSVTLFGSSTGSTEQSQIPQETEVTPQVKSCPAIQSCSSQIKVKQSYSLSLIERPTNLPVSWEIGSGSNLVMGMNNLQASPSELGFGFNLCEFKTLFVIGAASGDGLKDKNEILALNRANYLADLARVSLKVCETGETITIAKITLGQSNSTSNDGWNRRVIALASVNKFDKDYDRIGLKEIVQKIVKERSLIDLSNYSQFGVCLALSVSSDCHWEHY